ncbi:MAG TPA: glycosyltransferase family 39 protein [Magnetospirillaceae bacterium]|nr:glycosyltransferase family 39 protein [Magnetospirillaceae bacterium]
MQLTEGRRPYLILILLCLALYLPGLTGLPPIDRDESRFAQASKQMIESGDYIRIQFQGESRAKKPAGIYWMQVAAAKLTGRPDAIWAYRLPSVLGAILSVLLTFAFGQRLVGRLAALFGSALLACCFLLVSEAHQAKTDAMQLASVVLAQGALALFYLEREKRPGWGPAMAFWLAQAIGILIKGPVVPMISILTILTVSISDRSWSWLKGLRPLPGLVLVAVLVAPWAWAISHATQGQFLGTAVKTDLLPKLLGAQESHGGVPGTYLALMLATLWPASLLAVPALPMAWKRRGEPAVRYLLAWIVPNWLMFEAIPTKLPHYILPVYPAMALLAGMWLAGGYKVRAWHKGLALVWGLIGTALAATTVVAPKLLELGMIPEFYPFGLVILIAAWAPVVALWRGQTQRAALLAVVAALVSFSSLFAVVAPRLFPLWIGVRIAEGIPADAPLAAAGYHEPSLVFEHGTATRLTDGGGAAQFLFDTPGAWAAIESSAQAEFDAKLAEAGRTAEAVGTVNGFNYSRGRPAHVTLWRLRSD